MTKISRRDFVQAGAAMAMAAHPLVARARGVSKHRLMVGTQTPSDGSGSRGIYACDFDSTTGELVQAGLLAQAQTPSFLALSPNRRLLVSTNEIGSFQGKRSGAVSSFIVGANGATLTAVNQASSQGPSPCHIAFDHTGRCVFTANYSGGSAASFAIDANGRLSEAVSFFQYEGRGPARQQEGPHAHRVTVSPDNRFVLVNVFGLDQIRVYRLNAATAALTPNDPPMVTLPPGSGPRALIFHPNRRWVYSVNEVNTTVTLMHWDAARGALRVIETVSLLPAGHTDMGDKSAPSDIVIPRDGRFVYAANRLTDFIASFAVSPRDGRLRLMARTTSVGRNPRHIALDPSERWLVMATQDSSTLSVVARDPRTGLLAETGKSIPLSRPQCLVFV